jgi:hypothetical protein
MCVAGRYRSEGCHTYLTFRTHFTGGIVVCTLLFSIIIEFILAYNVHRMRNAYRSNPEFKEVPASTLIRVTVFTLYAMAAIA